LSREVPEFSKSQDAPRSVGKNILAPAFSPFKQTSRFDWQVSLTTHAQPDL